MKSMHLQVQMKVLLIGLTLLVLTAVSCKTSEAVSGPANCETGVLEGADFSFRDVLPGVDGHLQRERTYFVQGKLAMDTAAATQWWLVTDSISTPLRPLPLLSDTLRWSGIRNFYAQNRTGITIEAPAIRRFAVGAGSWLIEEHSKGCRAYALPKARHLETIALP